MGDNCTIFDICDTVECLFYHYKVFSYVKQCSLGVGARYILGATIVYIVRENLYESQPVEYWSFLWLLSFLLVIASRLTWREIHDRAAPFSLTG